MAADATGGLRKPGPPVPVRKWPSPSGRCRRGWMAVTELSLGLRLNADFYAQVVGPALDAWPHAAARLGTGSEDLGFDSARSTDQGLSPASSSSLTARTWTRPMGRSNAAYPRPSRAGPFATGGT